MVVPSYWWLVGIGTCCLSLASGTSPIFEEKTMARATLTNDLELSVTRSSAEGSRGGDQPRVPHLDVVREMIRTMETLTLAGQRHTMARIVGFIDQHATRCLRANSVHNRNMLEQSLAQLTRESQRISPDARSFGGHAEALLGLLAAAPP